jgi:hypothetical protein
MDTVAPHLRVQDTLILKPILVGSIGYSQLLHGAQLRKYFVGGCFKSQEQRLFRSEKGN